MIAPVLVAFLALSAANAALPVPPGYRAYALSLDRESVTGVRAGDRVDVMATFPTERRPVDACLTAVPAVTGRAIVRCWLGAALGGRDWVTATLMQNVLVLDARTRPDSAAGTVELALNPVEAQYLALAADSGKTLRVSRRGPGDVELHPMEMAGWRKLFR